jgi:three-Cys-motif partner protein
MVDVAVPEGDGSSQRFGSVHTALKLQMLGKYLPAYTTALASRFRLHYVDAFAGTGLCEIKVGDQRLLVPGSASLAIDCVPTFQHLVFIEKSKNKVRALNRLKDGVGDKRILVVRGDANEELPAYVNAIDRRNDRAIAFLDPFGMHVAWETLKQIAATRIVDVWYLFPLFGLYRQATRDAAAIDADKQAALTRILGTDEWRRAFYAPKSQMNLFGGLPDEERVVEVPQMLDWVKKRLESIFPGVLEPYIFRQTTESGKQGAPLFALFFLVSNDSPKAKALASRIAKSILDR